MASFAPKSQCEIPWCRSWHAGSTPDHQAQVAAWSLGAAGVDVFVRQRAPNPPVVRLIRVDELGRWGRDLDPAFALWLADVLEALPGRTAELIAALRTAAEELRP